MRHVIIALAVLLAANCGDKDPLPADVPHCALAVAADQIVSVPNRDDPLTFDLDTTRRTHWILTSYARVPLLSVAVSGQCALLLDNPPTAPGPGMDPTLIVDMSIANYHWRPDNPVDGNFRDGWICRWDFADPAWYTSSTFPDAARTYYTAHAQASVCYVSQ